MRRLHQSAPKNSGTSKQKLDYSILITVSMLVVFGLIMVYDAAVVQAFKDYGDKYYYIKQQLVWILLGIGCLAFSANFDYHNLRKYAVFIFAVATILLLSVSIPGLGFAAGGAHRWLKIGPLTIQPAEIIKLASIIFFASLFEKKIKIMPFVSIVSFICLIIGIVQKDLGSTVVFFLTCLSVFVVAGAPLKYFLTLLPVSIGGFLIFVLSSTYRRQRILAFLDPFSDPQGYSYHIAQVLIALGSGGLTGLGIGQSRQKFEYIPEVTTDSIFAIVGEELGFVGAVFLILLFVFLIHKGLKIAEKTDDRFGKLLAFGLTAWLAIQALVNLGAMVAFIPLTGVPLPFISYGGSALLVNLVAVGILLNISRTNFH